MLYARWLGRLASAAFLDDLNDADEDENAEQEEDESGRDSDARDRRHAQPATLR